MADKLQDRGHWGSKIAFILAASGSAIGLGSIWRFPIMVGRNGGAVFVMAYILPGAGPGLTFYLKPDLGKLDVKVLFFALGQAFYSLSRGLVLHPAACRRSHVDHFAS